MIIEHRENSTISTAKMVSVVLQYCSNEWWKWNSGTRAKCGKKRSRMRFWLINFSLCFLLKFYIEWKWINLIRSSAIDKFWLLVMSTQISIVIPLASFEWITNKYKFGLLSNWSLFTKHYQFTNGDNEVFKTYQNRVENLNNFKKINSIFVPSVLVFLFHLLVSCRVILNETKFQLKSHNK